MRLTARLVLMTIGTTLAVVLAACGNGHITPKSHLKSDSPEGAIAISEDRPASDIFVHLNANTNSAGICLLDADECIKPETKLLTLNKLQGQFWKSASPINIRTNMIISVIDQSATERKVLLRGKITRKDDEGHSEDMAAPTDLPAAKLINDTAVAYDISGTLSRDSSSASVVRMILQESALSNSVRVKVKGSIVNLRNSSITLPLEREVDVMDKGVIDFTVKGLDPDTVYRIENVTITDTTQGSPVKVRDPYFISTAADSKISKSRRRLVLRALNEAYLWDHNMYDSSLGYANSWGWCDRFYTWAANLEFKVRNQYSAQSFFEQYRALGDANIIPELGVSENLAGDFIRYEGTNQGTHTFMVVAFDSSTKQLWTVEGNFNNRVMRNQRKIYSPWMHGHLIEDQAR